MFFILNELSQKLKISIGKPYAKYEALPVCFYEARFFTSCTVFGIISGGSSQQPN